MRRIALACLLFASFAHAQIVTTVAGTDPALIASGVPALSAPFVRAADVAVDSSGNFYVADSTLHIVMRVSTDGTLTVIAGNGHAGFSGDGGPATVASLNEPFGVAVDSSGNLYIADFGNNRVRKVAGGIITTVAGTGTSGFSGDGGPATAAKLYAPHGVAVDTAGSLYIADFGNQRIRKVTAGTISTVAGNGTGGFSGDNGSATQAELNNPERVALDSAGNFYIADSSNNRIRKVSGGVISTVAGNGNAGFSGEGGPATAAMLDFPTAIAVDSRGVLYIGDAGNLVIRQVSGGIITIVAGNGTSGALGDGSAPTKASLNYPNGIAIDSSGAYYIADFYRGRIRKVAGGVMVTEAGNGQGSFGGDSNPATSALLNSPSGIAFDHNGNLYIADALNNRVRKVSGGIITTVAGNGNAGFSGDGGPATQAMLNSPFNVAVDNAGNLFITDTFNYRIRKVTNGVITTVVGNGTAGFSGDGGQATAAMLNIPSGITVDSAGNLYFADNNRVRKVSQGIISTVAGNGSAGFAGDGQSAVNASLDGPVDVAVDSAGNIYFADYYNYRVRKVSGGIITTVAGNGKDTTGGDGGSATAASFAPNAITVNAAGDLFIADIVKDTIRKVSGGTITTVAGFGFGFSGDGGPALEADFATIQGVAFDPNGNLFIADSGNGRIREVLQSANPSYQASPLSLSFSASAGRSGNAAQVVSLSSAVPGLAFTTSDSAPWLSVAPSSGTIPSTLQITADSSALSAGTYQGTVTITVPNASPATTTVAVTLTVQSATPATLGVDTQNVSLAAIQGGSSASQTINVLNTGAGSLPFTASSLTASGGPWLSVSPANGTATSSTPGSLTVTATPGSLAPGTYLGTISVSGGGKTIAIPVSFSVSAPTATILLSQSALSFTGVEQGGVPLSRNFGILNVGKGSMSWTATATTLSGGNWIQISPSSGTVTRPYLDVSLVTVSIDPRTLTAGTYYGRIQVSSAAGNTPQLMTVILTVLPAGTTLPAQAFPAGLIFTGTSGVTPPPQDVLVANPAGSANSFISGMIGSTGLDYLPKSANVQSTQPTPVHVYPDFSKLAGGTIQKSTITLQFSDNSPPQTITVLTVVAPPGAGQSNSSESLAAEPHASGCGGLSIVFREPQPSQTTFTAVAGQTTTMEAQISDCNTLVGQAASVQANFSSGPPVPLIYIGNGVWQGNWRPVSPGTVSMSVIALVPGQGGTGLGGQSATLTAVVSAPAPANATPLVTAQGVVHAASAIAGAPIAPGGLITIYGQNLADGAGQSNGVPLPDQLNGTQVSLGNQALPILYANPGQLNVQVPYGVPVNTQYQLTVRHGNSYSVPQPLAVAQAQPGIFTVNQQGFGQGSIVKSDGVTLAQPGTPAAIGETVVIYCTGLGSVTPSVPEGAPAPADPLSHTDNPVTVLIGGQPATVSFAGLTPGDPGLYQINAIVPSGIATGDAVPVVISVAGQTSPTDPAVTIAVR
ncbi:MAG TPA: IPT/TIG domain-containing protein [Bryobacteraceae bacterium]|nr:IPT/TIG domain-containing protein [Bryobacteraceae bacterium]